MTWQHRTPHPGCGGSRPLLTPRSPRFKGVIIRICAVLTLFLLLMASADGSDVERASDRVLAAREVVGHSPTNAEAAWRLAEAIYRRGDFATDRSDRESWAQQGLQAARNALGLDTNSAPAHFFLSMNLGLLAQARRMSALGLLPEMEKHLLRSIELEKSFRAAIAERSLGMLYRDAPGWPLSLGSRSKARTFLERAVQTAPDYPENLLTLMESEIRWGDRKQAASRSKAMEEMLKRAAQGLHEAEWKSSWADWNPRAERIRKALAPNPKTTPR
ncbi:MAG: hypothetical protein FJ405_00820 [Verrucomicrobia bacterium]|nr:hypothetical protein [Verrucomicrobiota bacterium]